MWDASRTGSTPSARYGVGARPVLRPRVQAWRPAVLRQRRFSLDSSDRGRLAEGPGRTRRAPALRGRAAQLSGYFEGTGAAQPGRWLEDLFLLRLRLEGSRELPAMPGDDKAASPDSRHEDRVLFDTCPRQAAPAPSRTVQRSSSFASRLPHSRAGGAMRYLRWR